MGAAVCAYYDLWAAISIVWAPLVVYMICGTYTYYELYDVICMVGVLCIHIMISMGCDVYGTYPVVICMVRGLSV